jgi:hypothetical protein
VQSDLRQKAGFTGLPDRGTLRGEREVFHVNTLEAFDGDAATTWTNVVHGAPVLTSEGRAARNGTGLDRPVTAWSRP